MGTSLIGALIMVGLTFSFQFPLMYDCLFTDNLVGAGLSIDTELVSVLDDEDQKMMLHINALENMTQ